MIRKSAVSRMFWNRVPYNFARLTSPAIRDYSRLQRRAGRGLSEKDRSRGTVSSEDLTGTVMHILDPDIIIPKDI